MDQPFINVSEFSVTNAYNKEFSIDEIMIEYCSRIDDYIGTIFIFSILYLLIEYLVMDRIMILLQDMRSHVKILDNYSEFQINNFITFVKNTSRSLFLVFNVIGFYLYGVQNNWAFSTFQLIMLISGGLLLIGSIWLKFFQGYRSK